eukprot:880525_1
MCKSDFGWTADNNFVDMVHNKKMCSNNNKRELEFWFVSDPRAMEDEKDGSVSGGHISPSLSYSSTTNPHKMTICIGKNQQQYNLNDLQLLSYFEALFSSRWKYSDTNVEEENHSVVVGDNKSLQFGIDELSCIIHIKKYNRIPPSYNYKKLILLCNASDFFSEDILNEELLIHFFKKCKPSLSFKVLSDLTKLNIFTLNNTNNKLISTSAMKYLQSIRNNISNMKRKWLEKYKSLPISHVSYDNEMIAQMFVKSFSIKWIKMQNETKRKWIIQCGDTQSFFHVWNIIKKRELYKYDRVIFNCIEKMCNDIDISVPVHHNVDDSVLIILKRIFIDTIQIVVSFNSEKAKRPSLLRPKSTRNSFMIDEVNDHKESLDNDDANGSESGASEYYDYHKFNLQELVRTHMEFIIVNRKGYFEMDELKQMLNIGHYMNGIQKYSFLKTLLSFHNDWQENIHTEINNKQSRDEYMLCWKNLIKYLIVSEVDYSTNCVSQWLPIFIDESKFILNTVGNALSTDGSHKLGFAIANYMTSNAVMEKKIDSQYIQYLGNSLGLMWKLNNVLSDLDDDLNDEEQQENDHVRVRMINLNDNNFFN